MTRSIELGINIDHVATVRQARRAPYPDPVHAALVAEQAGADNISCTCAKIAGISRIATCMHYVRCCRRA